MDVWYFGYGSNLYRDRFICYISGGKFQWGGKFTEGCTDKNLPKENRPLVIPYRLYFASRSSSWGDGGIAFISPERDESKYTYGRMWKITKQQFLEIKKLEGPIYDEPITLGHDEKGTPILTLTHSSEIQPTKPSGNYLKTIIAGLRETYLLCNEDILQYLIETPGIRSNWKPAEIIALM